MSLVALDVIANEGAERTATSLIKRGRWTDPEGWDPPSTERENQIIESKGWEVFGRFYLGRAEGMDPETKAFYKYPFSSDFANVDRKGLIAIRQRAGQTDEQEIFEAAGRLLALIEEQETTETRERSLRVTFGAGRSRPSRSVDSERGLIADVSLIQIGEAKGHGIFIDEQSLDSALVALGDGNLPAYVTHAGAIETDRLLTEIGVFSGFSIKEGKLRAQTFKALESFMADDPERFRRLFDLAYQAPDAFGVSLVFESDLVWVFADGKEVSIADDDGKGATRKIPSVRFKAISSADFVDAPAANNDGLFQSKHEDTPRTLRDVIREELEQLHPEGRNMTEETQDELKLEEVDPTKEETPEETPEEETEETPEEETDDLAALKEQVAAQAALIEELTTKVAELSDSLLSAQEQNKKLSAIVEGEEPLDAQPDTTDDKTVVAKFNEATGAEQTRIWRQNKQEILDTFRRN